MLSIEGEVKSEVEKVFQIFHSVLKEVSGQTEEPMMNVVASYQNEKWRILIFIRKKHRPDVFFEVDEVKRLLLSPAAVDIGGVCILPREEDFEKLTVEKLQDVFSEVFINESVFRQLKIKLKNDLGNIFNLDS